MRSSQHDGYHVGFIIQGFLQCEKLNEMCECNPTSIKISCQSCHSSFDNVFWSMEPYCQCICTIVIDVVKLNFEENMFNVGSIEEFLEH